jgi:anti-sigma B factor antagonist
MAGAVSSLLTVTLERTPSGVIVRPEGDLDLSTASDLAMVIEHDCRPGEDLILDLSRLSFLDCAGLRVLLYAQARADQGGGQLELVRGTDSVQRMLRLAGLEDRLAFR